MNAPAAPQVAPNGYPAMKVVRALAAASKRVAEVECNGKSGDPRDPYAYARADDLVAAAKDAIHAEGLLVLPASSDERPEPVGNGAVIWLRQTFNVVHVESGEWLPFSADPWPLQQHKPIDKAMATAKTASKAYFYLSLLEIRRVGPNAEDMDADVPPEAAPAASKPVTDSTAIGVSSRSKQSPSGARMSRQREEQSRERVDPEAVKAELDKAAREAFSEGSSGLAAHVDPDPTMPPTNAICVAHGVKGCAPCWGDELNPAIKDSGASSPESASVGTVPAEAPQPDKGNGSTSPPAACKSGPESTSSATSTDGATSTDLIQPTPSQVKAVDLLARRVAESRAGKWARSKEREARKAFLCSVCQPSVPDGGPPAEWEPAIKKGDKHRDGEKAGRCCLKCYERLMAEAEPVKEGA